jgi:hypothetical protein
MLAGLLASCSTNKTDHEDDLIEAPDTIKASVFNVGGEMFSVPSPVQTAFLIQKSGILYDKSVLNPSNKASTYLTNFSNALNLGVFGADLGYVALYGQTQDALGYLASIKQLSDKIGLSAAFDAGTMERIKNNITNKDSMTVLVGIAYRGSDAYLKNNMRSDISGLILIGGWIESMHFSAMGYKTKPNQEFKNRIAEQKRALHSIIKILDANNSEETVGLKKGLNDLSNLYEGISYTYNYIPAETDTVKKVTYIKSSTEIKVSEQQLSKIIKKIEEIRNKIVNNTQA